ncbi:MAG: Na(+)-translocating NADH-quinone reductase subunit A [Woeseiaceae bacterium]|nr:Na(+)-translocating NADH-quinone reductase subunit A [Woeseiaceae bacterium]
MRVTIKKGLDIPLTGKPELTVDEGAPVSTVAALGTDVVGLRPQMSVQVGDHVRLGQTLYVDKRNPGVKFTAPGAGEVIEINRGARRSLQSVVIRLEGDEAEEFDRFDDTQLALLDPDTIRRNLVESGLWTAFRGRPFSRIPAPTDQPAAIFVTAMNTNPLAADPAATVALNPTSFAQGLEIISRLTEGPVYVCTAPNSTIEVPERAPFRHVEFAGPHPAGLVGTHIHFLEPVSEQKTVWHLRFNHVMAIGRLFTTGRLPTERIVALTGPMVMKPRLLKTRLGASTEDLLAGELLPGQVRVISGSVMSGHRASGPLAYLSRYQNQITVLGEGSEREFLAWARFGNRKYSTTRAFTGHLLNRRGFDLTTTQNGSPRAMVSIGNFESLMPLDILATPLLKALIVQDTDRAKALGCLELDEEDLALCSFACNGKYDYGPFLRMNLDEIEANG